MHTDNAMFGIITLGEQFTVEDVFDRHHDLTDSLAKWDVIIVDAAEVRKVDVAALQMLVSAQKECVKSGRELILRKSEAVASLQKSLGINL